MRQVSAFNLASLRTLSGQSVPLIERLAHCLKIIALRLVIAREALQLAKTPSFRLLLHPLFDYQIQGNLTHFTSNLCNLYFFQVDAF